MPQTPARAPPVVPRPPVRAAQAREVVVTPPPPPVFRRASAPSQPSPEPVLPDEESRDEVPGHVGVEGNERADDLAKEAVQGVGARLKALADRRRREKQASRGYRTLAYRHELAESCTSDSSDESDEEEGEGGRAGLGRTSSARPAILPSPPLNSSGEIRHGRLLSRSLSAAWSAFKTAQKSAWAAL
jgi:hypothetical protein